MNATEARLELARKFSGFDAAGKPERYEECCDLIRSGKFSDLITVAGYDGLQPFEILSRMTADNLIHEMTN